MASTTRSAGIASVERTASRVEGATRSATARRRRAEQTNDLIDHGRLADSGAARGGKRGDASGHDGDSDSIGSATRALADAVSLLTRSITEGVHAVTDDVSSQLTESLREASATLAEASSTVARTSMEKERKVRADRTREKILASVRTLFAARGYEGASVADIAKDAGFTKGALDASLDSKEALFLTIARQLSDENSQWIAGHSKLDVSQAIDSLFSDEDSAQRALLSLETWIYAVRHPEAREELNAEWTHTLTELATVIAHDDHRADANQSDVDTAFGLVTVEVIAQVMATALGPDEVAPLSKRLTHRLLDRS